MGAYFEGTGRVKSVRDMQYTPSGKAVMSFSFANNSGTRESPVFSWYKAVLWGAMCERLAGKIQEGTRFYIHGRQHTETYQKSDGTQGVTVAIDVDVFEFVGEAPAQTEKPAKQDEESNEF